MRNEIVHLGERTGSRRAERWHGRAPANGPLANGAASVVSLFPERARSAREQPDSELVGCLELENAELRREVVELALQIQELKDRRR
jgi:hypothetical protein